MFTRSARMAVTTDSPWMDCERTAAIPCTPLIASSIGLVTCSSTCSGERPGASVWMDTCGGANSGNTSSGARPSVPAPTTTSAAASPSTTTRCRIDPRTSDVSMRAARDSLARLLAHCHARPEFFREELLNAGEDDGVARGERRPRDPPSGRGSVGRDSDSYVCSRAALEIRPGESLPLHDRPIGHQGALGLATLGHHGGDRSPGDGAGPAGAGAVEIGREPRDRVGLGGGPGQHGFAPPTPAP